MAQSIDRRGVQSVLDGYEKFAEVSDVPYYSVWQGKVLKFAYTGDNYDEGADLLKENLDYICTSQSQATYTLRVHKELDKDNLLSDRSPYYGSFNFRAWDPYAADQQGTMPAAGGYYGNYLAEMKREIQELKDTIAEKNESIGSFENPAVNEIMSILQHPLVAQLGSIIIDRFSGRNNNYNNNMSTSNNPNNGRHGLAGTEPADSIQDAEEKIRDAVNRLYAVDKDFPDVLQRLADLAEKNRKKYFMAKSFL